MTTEKKSPEIKEPIIKMADAIDPGLTLDDKQKLIPSPDTYEKSLVENGLDLSTAKKLQRHDQQFRAAATLASGRRAVATMVENPEIHSISGEFPMGEDRFLVQFDRTPATETEPESFEQWGRIRVKADGNTADMKAVRGAINELFAISSANASKMMSGSGDD